MVAAATHSHLSHIRHTSVTDTRVAAE
jgi:hypothetical protein